MQLAGPRARAPRARLARARRALGGRAARRERRGRARALECTTTIRRASRPRACRARGARRGDGRECAYQVRPVARGDARFERGRGAARFTARVVGEPRAGERPVRVYPNFRALANTRCSPPTTACRRSAFCSRAAAARAWISTSCANTARATPAPDRLEGHRAHRSADLARVPGRARPARPAGATAAGAWARRTTTFALRPRAERRAAARLRGAAPGRRRRHDDHGRREPLLAPRKSCRGARDPQPRLDIEPTLAVPDYHQAAAT